MAHKALLIGPKNDLLTLSQALLTASVDYQLFIFTVAEAGKEKINERLKYFFAADSDDVLFVYIPAEKSGGNFSELEALLRETKAASATVFVDSVSDGGSEGLFLNEVDRGKVIIGCERRGGENNLFLSHLNRGLMGAAAGRDGEVTPANLYEYLCDNMNLRGKAAASDKMSRAVLSSVYVQEGLPAYRRLAEFLENSEGKKKLLYLHTKGRDYSYIAYKKLLQKLEEIYDCIVRYGISEDASRPGFISAEVVLADIDIIIIEKTIGAFKVGEGRTDRFEPQIIYEFIQRGGLVIFLQGELSSAIIDYNRILSGMGLPALYVTRAIEEFGENYELLERELFNSLLVGHTKGAENKTEPLLVSADKLLIPRDFGKAFANVKKLALRQPIHLAKGGKGLLCFKDAEKLEMKAYPFDSKIWTGGDFLCFGSCNNTQIGNGILLTGDICDDALIEEYSSDALLFVADLLELFSDYLIIPIG